MKKRILWALTGLNLVLAVTLIGRVTADNSAFAQAKRPGDYVMIPGAVSGQTGSVVYMIDTGNGLLGAMIYDDSRKELSSMPAIDLARVFSEAAGGNRGNAGGVNRR